VKDNRPTNIDLASISGYYFPIPALASILHRASGIALLFGMGFLIWALSKSLHSEQQFNEVALFFATPLAKIILWIVVSSVIYHFVAGLKHLVMDTGIGETLVGARIFAWGVLILSFILIAVATYIIFVGV